ncbi:pseudouridine-5'-phosphate glycosidase [Rhodococcus pyridinivorans]|uniref:pseudouridine-5'-phosphate glycosidase n=1 Tax=Rhodococcus pyridinivorans TaxID=103816 RepID=UPI0020C8D407|nr:pseudouridine-5'-phosphate glycosidase [Rhodococcus pyridinivorans]
MPRTSRSSSLVSATCRSRRRRDCTGGPRCRRRRCSRIAPGSTYSPPAAWAACIGGASSTFDESADLVALATLPILVVSGGVKSVLDIPATLERLETLGVVVVGYRTTRFPGFYVRDSGCDVDEVESAEQAAAVARARDGLGLRAAVLVGNPVAAEAQIDPELHDRVLAEAEHAAAEAGTRGKAITPFLLEHMHRATEGRSLETNVAVYRGNVAVAAEIAHALAS